ncbi:cysteine-rich tail protein 1 [Tachyglossus aculeatus]|uniref:cysteine-rich tail protein 1 n=1 Tax=Tachyglossus aculeatus TaxID=9261 RepID=UPI0018F77168|nr:cysteine-rich tail protein 1 [Tachyglossus aculeatus]
MDPHEAVVKNPYASVVIPRAHLRPDLGQAEARPSEPKGGPPAQEAWCQAGNPYASLQRPAGCPEPRPAAFPLQGPGDDIAHNCCCCPCCSCCHCPPCCRCHQRCCCVVS